MNATRLVLFGLLLSALLASHAASAPKPSRYADLILADKPAAYWRLNDDATGVVRNLAPGASASALNGTVDGKVQLGARAQLSAEFPEFEPDSTAAGFSGKGEFIRVKDPGANSPLDFKQGDSITLEAWVSLNNIKDGQQIYVVGKGRTGNKGFASDNQNYALRLRGDDSAACVSFLFRDAARSLEIPPLTGAGGKIAKRLPLDYAIAGFDWVVRQVRLSDPKIPDAGEQAPPAAILRRGIGSALQRAQVFLALLEQFGLEEADTSGLQGCLVYRPDEKGVR